VYLLFSGMFWFRINVVRFIEPVRRTLIQKRASCNLRHRVVLRSYVDVIRWTNYVN